MVHPGKHLCPVERVFHILVRSDVGPSVWIVTVDCHLAPCYRSAFRNKNRFRRPLDVRTCAEFRHGVNIDAAVLIDKGIDRKLMDILHKVLVTADGAQNIAHFRWQHLAKVLPKYFGGSLGSSDPSHPGVHLEKRRLMEFLHSIENYCTPQPKLTLWTDHAILL